MSCNVVPQEEKVANRLLLSEEERTPKKLKALEPDLTVVVGGIEFYHYKAILCSGCDFFDTILGSQMKENGENRIEFPDKNPDEWLDVYSFIDTSGSKPTVNGENAMTLFAWFDYFGMDDLVVECDEAYAGYVHSNYCFAIGGLDTFIKIWDSCKSLPFPKSQEAALEILQYSSVRKRREFLRTFRV